MLSRFYDPVAERITEPRSHRMHSSSYTNEYPPESALFVADGSGSGSEVIVATPAWDGLGEVTGGEMEVSNIFLIDPGSIFPVLLSAGYNLTAT